MLLAGCCGERPLPAVRRAATLHADRPHRPVRCAPLAHSALLVLEAARLPRGWLAAARARRRRARRTDLAGFHRRPRRAGERSPARSAGRYRWPQPPASGAHRLEVMVAHDGIREVLDGTVATAAAAAPVAAGGRGLLRDHKQLAWWILNIAIVLIAVIAISRRMS